MTRIYDAARMLLVSIHTLALICMAIFVAVIVHDYIPDHWALWTTIRTELLAWSTLIAGILAVFAALFTVRQMKITDQNQQNSHKQLIKLSLRADQLLLERAAIPHLHYLREAIDDVSAYLGNEKEMKKPQPAFVFELFDYLEKILSQIDSDDIKLARHLFGPRLHQTYKQMIEMVPRLRELTIYLNQQYHSRQDPRFEKETLLNMVRNADTVFQNLKWRCIHFADDLEDLLETYKS